MLRTATDQPTTFDQEDTEKQKAKQPDTGSSVDVMKVLKFIYRPTHKQF